MHKLAWLLAASLLAGPDDETETQVPSAERTRRIAQRLDPVERKTLRVLVQGQQILVSGTIDDAEDARRVLDSILDEEDVRHIRLDLRVGQRIVIPVSKQQMLDRLNWLDQFDNQPFGPGKKKQFPEFSSIRRGLDLRR